MAVCRVANFVNALNHRIAGRVVANGVVGAKQVVVDGPRNSDNGNRVFLKKFVGAGKGSVSANHHEAFNALCTKVGGGFGAAFRAAKGMASGGFQHGSALRKNVAHAFAVKRNKVRFDKAVVAAVDPKAFQAIETRGANHRANGGIHARRISSRGQYCNAFHRFTKIVFALGKVTGTLVSEVHL